MHLINWIYSIPDIRNFKICQLAWLSCKGPRRILQVSAQKLSQKLQCILCDMGEDLNLSKMWNLLRWKATVTSCLGRWGNRELVVCNWKTPLKIIFLYPETKLTGQLLSYWSKHTPFMGSELETSLIRSAVGPNLSSPILQVQATLVEVGSLSGHPYTGDVLSEWHSAPASEGWGGKEGVEGDQRKGAEAGRESEIKGGRERKGGARIKKDVSGLNAEGISKKSSRDLVLNWRVLLIRKQLCARPGSGCPSEQMTIKSRLPPRRYSVMIWPSATMKLYLPPH